MGRREISLFENHRWGEQYKCQPSFFLKIRSISMAYKKIEISWKWKFCPFLAQEVKK
jgi:hypothetical protein